MFCNILNCLSSLIIVGIALMVFLSAAAGAIIAYNNRDVIAAKATEVKNDAKAAINDTIASGVDTSLGVGSPTTTPFIVSRY